MFVFKQVVQTKQTTTTTMPALSKLATSALTKKSTTNVLNKVIRTHVAIFNVQTRKLQTQYKPGQSISFVDMMTGVYEDPRYQLDLKPAEWRESAQNSYLCFGAVSVGIPMLLICGICAFCLVWYTVTDTDSVLSVTGNTHPFFAANSGADYDARANPAFAWVWPYGHHGLNARHFFYDEIANAVSRKGVQQGSGMKL